MRRTGGLSCPAGAGASENGAEAAARPAGSLQPLQCSAPLLSENLGSGESRHTDRKGTGARGRPGLDICEGDLLI